MILFVFNQSKYIVRKSERSFAQYISDFKQSPILKKSNWSDRLKGLSFGLQCFGLGDRLANYLRIESFWNTGRMRFDYFPSVRTSHHKVIAGRALGLNQLMGMNILALCWTTAVRAADLLNCHHFDNLIDIGKSSTFLRIKRARCL